MTPNLDFKVTITGCAVAPALC